VDRARPPAAVSLFPLELPLNLAVDHIFRLYCRVRKYHRSLMFVAWHSSDERPNPSKDAGNAIDTRLGRGEVRLREGPINDANSQLFYFAVDWFVVIHQLTSPDD